jgi:hypothetical protein
MYTPTRKVRSNGRTVVGEFSSQKRLSVQFESALEENLLYILNFDSDVLSFHDQPLKIEYKDDRGRTRSYTPDYLVEYRNRNPVLFEVKSSELLKNNYEVLAPGFEAAKLFASKKGWEFQVITDKEVKTTYCENVRFLHGYHNYKQDLFILNQVQTALSEIQKSTPGQLVKYIESDSAQWPVYITAIWTLIIHKKIGCDLFSKVHMEVPIWLTTPDEFNELKYPYAL